MRSSDSKKESKRKRNRQEALVIIAKEGMCYAGLRQILLWRSLMTMLHELHGTKRRIAARTIEDKEWSRQPTKGHRASLDEEVTVRVNRSMVMIEYNDLDEATIKEEIVTALKDQLKLEEVQEKNINSLWEAYGRTKAAALIMSMVSLTKALSGGSIYLRTIWLLA